MRLLDVLTAPWAIAPDKLLEIRAIYETHLRGEKIDIKGVEARLGEPLHNEPRAFDVVDGVAVLPLIGVIAKRMNLFTRISGGTSTELARRDFKEVLEDPSVRAIVLHIDSPGGQVDGTQEFARTIFEARGRKPIVAFGNGTILSGAMWIGSAAERVFLSSPTALAGSIGVVATHVDVSKSEESMGVKTTEIVAGRFKRIASQFAPLSEAGREYLQERVDRIFSVFVSEMAEFRGVSVEEALEQFADGSVFVGQQAIDAGLVDGLASLDEVIARLAAGDAANRRPASRAGVAQEHFNNPESFNRTETIAMSETKEVNTPTTAAELEAAFPDLVGQVRQGAQQAGYDAGLAEGRKQGHEEGAQAERQRIKDVEAQLLPGHEQLIETLKYDGRTTGPEAAVQVLNAERGLQAQRLTDLKADAPKPMHALAPESSKAAASRDEQKREAIAQYKAAHPEADDKTAIREVARQRPELFL